jgi:hypothetical protein
VCQPPTIVPSRETLYIVLLSQNRRWVKYKYIYDKRHRGGKGERGKNKRKEQEERTRRKVKGGSGNKETKVQRHKGRKGKGKRNKEKNGCKNYRREKFFITYRGKAGLRCHPVHLRIQLLQDSHLLSV